MVDPLIKVAILNHIQPAMFPLGDSALTITFGSTINRETNAQVHSLFSYFKKESFAGIVDVIPAYASLTLVYDILEIKKVTQGSAYKYVHSLVEKALPHLPITEDREQRHVELPVCYDVSFGFDLNEMSVQNNISIAEIVQLHVAKTYQVYMIGFLPGFAYMGSVDQRIAMPRQDVPRTTIPAGSVGIAGQQTGIYPLDSPGGWNIIGRTPVAMFNPGSIDTCLLQPGDIVKFYPISLHEFNEIKAQQ